MFGKKGEVDESVMEGRIQMWQDLMGHYKDFRSKCNRKLLEGLKRKDNLI